MKKTTTNTTIGQSILSFRERTAEKAVQFKKNHKWQSRSWPEYYKDLEMMGAGLLALGVKPNDRVAVMSSTRYEWSVMDLATMGVHAIVVSIYQNNTPEDIQYIVNNSGAKILFIETEATLPLWQQIASKCPSIEKVVLIENKSPYEDKKSKITTWDQVRSQGIELLRKTPTAFEKLCGSIKSTDTATLLYTSGTTGTPKGVVITHTQIISEVAEAFTMFGVDDKDVSLSFLPYAHVFGRIEHWGHAYMGFTMAYAESIEKVRVNLTEVRPTFLLSVPRIYEKIYSAIGSQVDSSPIKKKMFEWAVGVGRKITELKLTHQTIPLELLATYEVAKRLVLSKVTSAFGGRLRFAVSGGAPLAQDISSFFHAAGVLILEGYGLTETTAAITVNTPFNYKFGSVGRPIGDTQLKIAEDGEVLVRSKKVMKEYYNNPEATAEVFTGDWFHTGDIGIILQGGDLKITDRKKDLIKTAGGKYVAPQKLEGLLKLHPLISQALISGDQKKYIVAVLTLDAEALQKMAKAENENFSDWKQLTQSPWIQDKVRDLIAETNAGLASWESIKRFLVLPTEFTVESGELTPSLKLKRKFLTQKLHTEIESLYN
ncbi:MAG: long-chain fatty acid--CoA ligase [Bdellovibrionaceae bacterium]|nr:long-chain fatty acid--CoA ligase [Pseudobdellovibrionaceae bacterium]